MKPLDIRNLQGVITFRIASNGTKQKKTSDEKPDIIQSSLSQRRKDEQHMCLNGFCGSFTKSDIAELCPIISVGAVENSIAALRTLYLHFCCSQTCKRGVLEAANITTIIDISTHQ